MRAVPPLGAADGTTFTDGNPATGVEGSPLPAEFFNSVNAEVVNVIKQGLGANAPAAGNLTQLYQAILALIAANGMSFASTAEAQALANTTKALSPARLGDVLNQALPRRGMANTGLASLTAAATLTQADHGKVFYVGTNTFTATLPLSSSVVDGTTYTFIKSTYSGVQTIAAQGGDTLRGVTNGSIPMCVESAVVQVVKHGASWLVVQDTGAKASWAANSGYQRLPSGMYMQWGQISVPANTTTDVTLPIAASVILMAMACLWGGPSAGIIGAAPVGSTAIRVSNNYSQSHGATWLAFTY